MYWSLQKHDENVAPEATSPVASVDGENETDIADEVSNLAIDDAASENASS